MIKNIFLLLLSLLFLELVLLVVGFNNNFAEKTTDHFYTDYGKKLPSWFYTWGPDNIVDYKQPEFEFTNVYNHFGLREKNIPPSDTSVKILFLGDSFTEGDGTIYENSMPRQYEKLMQQDNSNIRVYNAGSCGNDPLYSYMMYKYKLDSFAFKRVFLCINNSDITDVYLRGGFERFKNDSTTQFRKRPWFSYAYQYSRLFRLVWSFTDRDENGMVHSDDFSYYHEQYSILASAIDSLNNLCIKRGASLTVVMHPFPSSFYGHCEFILGLTEKLQARNICLINLYPDFKKILNKNNYTDYSWPVNGHFNAKGYALYARLLYNNNSPCNQRMNDML